MMQWSVVTGDVQEWRTRPSVQAVELERTVCQARQHALNVLLTRTLSRARLNVCHVTSPLSTQVLSSSTFHLHIITCSFRVICDRDLPSEHISSCSVPEGSLLGPLLFVMYTTPLSTLISSLSLNGKIITFMQMILNFFSFHPRNFDSSIAHLQTALQQMSSWMSALAVD